MTGHRRMTDTERERDLRRRNINPHAPCVISDTGTPASVWAPVDMRRPMETWILPRDQFAMLCQCSSCQRTCAPYWSQPDCETGEEMSFAEWLRRQGLGVDRKAGVLRLSGVMEVAS